MAATNADQMQEYINTPPPPPPTGSDAGRPGHWVGNQWVYNDVVQDPTKDPNNPGKWVNGQWIYDNPTPDVPTAPAPPTGSAPAPPTGSNPPGQTEGPYDWREPAAWVQAQYGAHDFEWGRNRYPAGYWVDLIQKDAGQHPLEYWKNLIETQGQLPETGGTVSHNTGGTSTSGGAPTGLSGTGVAPPPATTISRTYNDIISQLLNTTGPTTTTGSSFNAPPKSQFNQLVYDQIMKMLNGPSVEDVGKSAANSLPVSAYRNSMLRDLGVQQSAAAEASGLNGTQGSGGFQGRTEALRQAAGESTAKFTGEYVDKAMADRRAELQHAMDMAQQQGNFEDAQALQAEIARLDVEIRQQANANQRYATEVQKLLGLSDVELRRYLGGLQDATSRYGIDVGAQTAANRLELDWFNGLSDDDIRRLGLGINGPGKV